MKKPLLAFGGALLLLAVILVIRDQMEKAAQRPKYAYTNLQEEEVIELRIRYQGDSARLLRVGEGDDGWVTATDSVPVDSLKIATALKRIRGIEKRELVSRDPDSSRLAEYGLDSGEIKRVEWVTSSGDRQTALLGKASGTDYASNYWKYAGSPEIYRTPRSITYDLSPRPVDWKAKAPFPFFLYEDVQSVEVRWVDSLDEAHHYKLDRISDTAAKLVEPFESEVPRENAAKVFLQTPQFVIDGFVDPEDPHVPASDLDNPALTVRTTMNDGAVHLFEAGPAIDDHHYARHPGAPRTYIKIRKWRVDFFKKTVDELLAPPPPEADIEDGIPELPEPGSEEFYRMQRQMEGRQTQ